MRTSTAANMVNKLLMASTSKLGLLTKMKRVFHSACGTLRDRQFTTILTRFIIYSTTDVVCLLINHNKIICYLIKYALILVFSQISKYTIQFATFYHIHLMFQCSVLSLRQCLALGYCRSGSRNVHAIFPLFDLCQCQSADL